MTENFHPADTNGDGEVSDAEQKMYMEFKRKELKTKMHSVMQCER